YAFAAGLCGFLLGLVHTYDIITMSAVWVGYLVTRLLFPIIKRGFPRLPVYTWLHALIAGAITTPSVLYIAWQLHTEAVFSARADVKTTSAALIWILLGYGLTLMLALVG